ncbi:MAG: hypothetical protein QNL26_03950, partial [Acidimicrobiia bacterium]|nr:hypothetical protein [Acidimicrobiia bacterium]
SIPGREKWRKYVFRRQRRFVVMTSPLVVTPNAAQVFGSSVDIWGRVLDSALQENLSRISAEVRSTPA